MKQENKGTLSYPGTISPKTKLHIKQEDNKCRWGKDSCKYYEEMKQEDNSPQSMKVKAHNGDEASNNPEVDTPLSEKVFNTSMNRKVCYEAGWNDCKKKYKQAVEELDKEIGKDELYSGDWILNKIKQIMGEFK